MKRDLFGGITENRKKKKRLFLQKYIDDRFDEDVKLVSVVNTMIKNILIWLEHVMRTDKSKAVRIVL